MFDATFVATLALLLFAALMVRLKVPRKLLAALDRHSKKIRDDLDEARKLRDEAQSLFAEAQRRAEDADKEAETIIAEAQSAAESIRSEAMERAQVLVERKENQVEQRIAQAEAQALAQMRERIALAAVSGAEEVLRDTIDAELAAPLLDEAIDKITEQL